MSRCDKDAIFADYVGDPFTLEAKCIVCDNKLKKDALPGSIWEWEKGHIFSVSMGGKDVYPNLVPLCKSCNRSMGNKNLWEFKLEKKKISLDNAKYHYMLTKQKIDTFDPQCDEKLINGGRCRNRKYGYIHNWCKLHIPNHIDYMEGVVFTG